MKVEVGIEYNINSSTGSAKGHSNPIFRGTVIKTYHHDKFGMVADIRVTEYNISPRYSPGNRINVIGTERFTSIVERPNKNSKNVLTKFKEDGWYA